MVLCWTQIEGKEKKVEEDEEKEDDEEEEGMMKGFMNMYFYVNVSDLIYSYLYTHILMYECMYV